MGFKMKGISPIKTRGHGGKKGHTHPTTTKADSFTRTSYHEKGYTDKKKKRPKHKKAWKFTKVGKLLRKLTGGGGSRGGSRHRDGNQCRGWRSGSWCRCRNRRRQHWCIR